MTHVPADSTLDRAIALLDRLVAFDTESSRSNLPLIDFVEDYLLGLGARFTRIPNAEGDKAALFATFGPDVDGGVVLSGHTDVVPVTGPEMDARRPSCCAATATGFTDAAPAT